MKLRVRQNQFGTSLKNMSRLFLRLFEFKVSTRDVFYVRREVDLRKTAKVNAYIMHIFGKMELLSIHAT